MGETLKITGVNAPIEVEGMTPMIFKAINNVMRDTGAIGKDSKNQSQGFKFRGVDAVMNALNPSFIKHGVFVVPKVLEQNREERTNSKGTTLIYTTLKVQYRFYAEDGSFVEAVVVGEGMDSGDKSCSKALSIAYKYACFQVLSIPTEDMVDPDYECHEVAPKVDEETVKAIKEARVQMKALKWDETKVFSGRTLEQLNKTELAQAIGTIQAKYTEMINKESANGTER